MLIAALASVVVCTALSQPSAPLSDSHLTASLRKDSKLELLDQSGKRQKVTLVQVDDANVVLRTKSGTVTVPTNELQLTTRRGDPPWEGAAVGLGAGLLVSWAILEQHDPAHVGYSQNGLPPIRDDAEAALGITVLSTGVGLLIDLLHVGHHQVLTRAAPARQQSTLGLGVTRHAGVRQLQVAYRLAF